MEFTAALPFGQRVSAPSDEESVMERIGKFFQLQPPERGTSSGRRGSVESCDETDTTSLCPGWDSDQRLPHQDVTQQMERCLTEAKASTLHCQLLLLPLHLLTRIGQHIMRSSAEEPCGLRGASIKLFMDSKAGLKPAGSIFPDPSVCPTFELSVVLKVEDGWPPLRCIFDSTKVVKLRPEYRLVKRKLYSSASPVVHDCS
ncbi:DNA damage-inducible transcript 4-like protein-like [Nematolebias whitei]|uniref:DNA damage-inducible transcript 4-like protein-like n=1 Tax=Nematolebias whitei TaxID=451745 RepID=UPI0018996919|nr:DNA damage-inducible transcript 4-like protein-like [Nematolebias whitei]